MSAAAQRMSARPPTVTGMFRAGPTAMALALTIAGCAGPMGTIRPGPSVPSNLAQSADIVAPPVTSFDGSYQTTIRLAGSAGSGAILSWCETPGQPTVTVANGQFTYAVPHPNVPGNPTPTYPATMAQNGSFAGQITGGTISGRIDGTHIEGSIDGTGCLYAFAGDRI